MGVYGIDSLLQSVSSGQSMNCSLNYFSVGFKRETGRLQLDIYTHQSCEWINTHTHTHTLTLLGLGSGSSG